MKDPTMTMECDARGVSLLFQGVDYFDLQPRTDVEAGKISSDLNFLALICNLHVHLAEKCSQKEGQPKTDCEQALAPSKTKLDERIRNVLEHIDRWDRERRPPIELPPRKQDVRW
jgi:hypothetical protein